MLPRAPRSVGIIPEAWLRRRIPRGHQQRMGAKRRRIELKPFGDVGLYEDVSSVNQEASHLGQQIVGDHEAFFVALLPPGVRKVDEERGHRAVGRKQSKRIPSIGVKDAGALAEAVRAQPLVDKGGPLETDLQAKKPNVGPRLGSLEKEAAPARPGISISTGPSPGSKNKDESGTVGVSGSRGARA